MRNLLSTVLLLAATLAASAQNDLKSVLSQLDATLSHRDSYIAGREQRIESLKNILRKSDFSDAQRYILNQQLIDEYTPYQADSTIDYLYRNIALATRMNDAGHLNESRIQLAYLYSSAGIYLEAANMLKLVTPRRWTAGSWSTTTSPATNSTTNSSSTPTTRRRDTNRGGLR